MKKLALLVSISYCLLQAGTGLAQTSTALTLHGVFVGRTPCQELAKQISEKTTAECIKIKWKLTLYKDPVNAGEGTYELQGFVFKKAAPALGKWQLIKGTKKDPQAIVYVLNLEGKEPLLLQKGDDNVLFFLDKEKKLMVGNRDFSYTLNRVQ